MIRTRFAPSPTGYLHIGGVRTALFSWLFARHHQGRFILRIEDTDRVRSTPEAIQAIVEGLTWLGLDYDEGPYFQTQRFDHYQTALHYLLETGAAYRCDCSAARLEALRAEQIAHKQKPRYDGFCRERYIPPTESSFVIRFRSPQSGTVTVEDQVHGIVHFENAELDDLVIARSDGTPTYNFTVVVDDHDMGITHVIRGDDHLNNTPRQINLLKALKAPIPVYAHVPMIQGANGKKLSKREGALNVTHYRDEGYLPEAVINYLVRLGWSHGNQEIFSRDELIQAFDGSHLSKSPAILNLDKLLWLNQHYLKQAAPNRMASLLQPFIAPYQQNNSYTDAPMLSDIVLAQRDRVKTLKEMAEKSRFLYEAPQTPGQIKTELGPALQFLYTQLNQLATWEETAIHLILQQTVQHYQLVPGQFFQHLRQILTGSRISPPIDSTIKLLGKSQVLSRLNPSLSQ